MHEDYLEELFGEKAEGDYGSAYSDTLMKIVRDKLKSLKTARQQVKAERAQPAGVS